MNCSIIHRKCTRCHSITLQFKNRQRYTYVYQIPYFNNMYMYIKSLISTTLLVCGCGLGRLKTTIESIYANRELNVMPYI